MSSPLSEIGVDEPMFVCGAIAARSDAIAITAPAESALEPGRRDVDDDGHLDGEEALDDPAHRRAQAAGRVEDEHDRGVAAVLGAVDRVLDVLLRDGVDVVVEVDGENARLRPSLSARERPAPPRAPRRASERARNPRKQGPGTGVRILSAEVRRPCPRTVRRATLDSPCADLFSPSSSPLLAGAGRSERVRLERGACDDRRAPRDWRAQRVGDDGRSSAVHACRGLVAWQRDECVFRTRSTGGRWSAWRPGGARGRGRPGRRIARAAACAAGGSGIRGGSGRRIVIEARAVGNVTRVRAQLVWSPEIRIPLRRSGRDRDAADRAAALVGGGRVDPARPADATRPTCGSRSSTTRPVATTTRAPRPPRS